MLPDRAVFRLEQLRSRLVRGVRARLGVRNTVYVSERVEEYRGYWEEAARTVGAEFHPLTRDVWEVRARGKVLRFSNHIAPCDDYATRVLAGDKVYCYRLAEAAGVPVAEHIEFRADALAPARRFAREHSPPFVVKPAKDTASGLGITTGLQSWNAVLRAAALAAFYGRDLLLERMIAGESCRLLYLGGKLIHAVRRRGVRVVGDGDRSLGELLLRAGQGGLADDWNTRFTLAAQRLGLSDRPARGVEVLVRSLPAGSGNRRELRTVYDEDVTALCDPALAEELGRVVAALGSEFAGIDIICNDLGRPLKESGGTFLEINTTPGIHHHCIPSPRNSDPVAKLVLTHLLEGAPNGRA